MHHATPWRISEAVLCFPIRAQGQLTAFVALGQQLHGEAYGVDDCDLLRGIAHHVGAFSLMRNYPKNAKPRLNWKRCIGFPCSVCMT